MVPVRLREDGAARTRYVQAITQFFASTLERCAHPGTQYFHSLPELASESCRVLLTLAATLAGMVVSSHQGAGAGGMGGGGNGGGGGGGGFNRPVGWEDIQEERN